MKIIAINGSHRPGRGTAVLLSEALSAAQSRGASTELIELSKLSIGYCAGCNACLRTDACTLRDDMDLLYGKMREADGIIFGTPDYFSNVSARMKCMIDRTRPLHMVENTLKDKAAGIVVTAGLNNCGAETAVDVLARFCLAHEMHLLNPRVGGPVRSAYVTAIQMSGVSSEGMIEYRRSPAYDPIAIEGARHLGATMVAFLGRLAPEIL